MNEIPESSFFEIAPDFYYIILYTYIIITCLFLLYVIKIYTTVINKIYYKNLLLLILQISTAPEPENYEFAQSTSRSNVETIQSTTKRSETSLQLLTPNGRKTSHKSPKTDESGKSKQVKRLHPHRLRSKKKYSKNNLSMNTDSEPINIDVNIQDVTLKRTLTKRNFFKKKKLSVNGQFYIFNYYLLEKILAL